MKTETAELKSIAKIDNATQRKISSGQVISSIDSVIKELIENSIDANASYIQINLYGDGLLEIQVKDNGVGIKEEDCVLMAQRYTTSKCNELDKINTYGFRGEALNSICVVSRRVVISTRTQNEPRGRLYNLDTNGCIQSQKEVNFPVGTFVSVFQLFHHFPVRRQDASKCTTASNKSVCEIIKRYSINELVMIYISDFQLLCPLFDLHSNHIAQTVLTLSLTNQKHHAAWYKQLDISIEKKDSLKFVFRTIFVKTLKEVKFVIHHVEQKASHACRVIFQQDSNCESISASMTTLFFLNARPITKYSRTIKNLFHALRECINEKYKLHSSKKLFLLVSVETSADLLDVNLEPNKEQVDMLDETDVSARILCQFKEAICEVGGDIGKADIECVKESQEVSKELGNNVSDELTFIQPTRSQWSAGHVANVPCPSTLYKTSIAIQNVDMNQSESNIDTNTPISKKVFQGSENKYNAISEKLNRPLPPIFQKLQSSTSLKVNDKIFLSPNMSSPSNPTQEENIESINRKYSMVPMNVHRPLRDIENIRNITRAHARVVQKKAFVSDREAVHLISESDSESDSEILTSHCLLNEIIILDTSNMLMHYDNIGSVGSVVFEKKAALIEFAERFFSLTT